MGPSRRKGSSRASSAAATAAACRKWKVGDLVLAKVKGFPAWPATVSAPEKWGYVAGWKKVLVHFFGTQQIAFCNPADVEAFTEEKKETLLVRRHGKGADFIRAVREIIESYEESKKLEQVVDINYVDEATATNAENLDGDTALKDQFEAPYAMVSYGVIKSYSTGEKNKPSLTVGDAADATVADVGGRDASSEGPINRSVVTKKPRANILFSEKERGDVDPQSSSLLKRNSSACRSRSSSRGYTSRFQKPILSSSNGKAEDIAAKVLQNGFVRRSKRIRKSPDVSEGNDTGSPVFLSNGSNGENGSEIVRVGLDIFSLTEGTTVEFGCKPLQPESIVECGERDVELRQVPSFQTKAVVLKKKRKPNRKRVSNGDPENIGRLNKTDAEVDMHKTGQVLPISHERYSKEDGDEHLPLVKRARVRMGKPSSVEEELDTVIQLEDKLLEVSNSFSRRVSTQLQEHGPDQNSFVIDGATENALLPNEGSPSPAQLLPQLRDANKKQLVCSVDGEAALPPSKRLHRALEAMSANAAEDGQTEEPSSTKMLTDGGCSLSITDSPHMCMKSRVSNEFGLENVDILTNSAPQGGTRWISDICGPADRKESVESSKDVAIYSEPVRSSCSPEHELCRDIHMDAEDHFDSKGIVFSLSGTQTSEAMTVALSPKLLSPDPGEKQTCLGCKQGSLAHMSSRNDECRNDNSESEFTDHKAENPLNELEPSYNSAMSSDRVSTAVDCNFLPQNDTDLLPCSMEGNCSGSSKLWKLPLHANDQVDGMCEAVKEIKRTQRESNGIQTPASTKVMAAPAEGPPTFSHSISVSENHFGDKDVSGLLLSSTEVMKEIKPTQTESNGLRTPTAMKVMDARAEGPPNLSHSSSVSDDHLGDKDVSGIRPSSTPAHVDSLACPSPATTSICNTSTSDNDNILDNNGCCSPDVHLRHAKSKIISKWSNKAEAAVALASFQSAIGTLTRTKESIGRATRIAIDCAKFGIAAKVVEILVRDLQSESSLRRKVDLFFLVDSITQCSRSCRGGIDGIYPTAIQAVLPRLLLAAAPPGSDTQENRRQCLKVLRLWLERRILPDSVVRRHIRDLESLGVSSSSSGAYSRRRPLRTERAFDDPIRQMEGMLVDEYGSNSSFQLPGFHMPTMLKDEVEGSDSDGGSFEAVTPEHDDTQKGILAPASVGNHTHILEDVDGELEMEDVAPTCEAVTSSTPNACIINTSLSIHPQLQQQFPPTFVLHIPLTTSPPPPLLPSLPHAISDSHDSKFYSATENLQQQQQQQFVAQQSVVPGVNSSDAVAAAVLYQQAPESRDSETQTQIPDTNPVLHQPIVFVNGVQQTDGANFYSKAYHLPPPPQPAPSNQFSYVQADRPLPPPSPYPPNTAHFAHSTDGGAFYTDRENLKMISHEQHRGEESWKFPEPSSFTDSRYTDPAGGSYPPAPYSSGSPPLTNQGRGFPPQSINHREFMPQRPPSRGPIPAATRGIIRF